MSIIRQYLPSDKPALLELIRLNTPQYFDPSEGEWFSNFLDQEVEDYFVMEDEGRIVGGGGVNYENQQNTAVLSWGMIHPQLHKKGLGSTLTKHRVSHASKQAGVKQIIVRTSQHTHGFYQKMGFTIVKTKKDHWAKGLDLYYMEMILVKGQ